MTDDQTRDRVRALVRDVLAKAAPDLTAAPTPTRFVDMAPAEQKPEEVTRDESSKVIITEDDVRGLEAGAVLKIGEHARLTPLAADIVKDRGIQIVRRSSRRGSLESKLVAVGADHG